MKIIYSNMDDEKSKEDMLTLLRLRQRLFVDVIAGEKGNYGYYVIGMMTRIGRFCFMVVASLFFAYELTYIDITSEKEHLTACILFLLLLLSVAGALASFVVVKDYRIDMTWDAIPDEYFREDTRESWIGDHLYYVGDWKEKGCFKRNNIRGSKREYSADYLCNRFRFGWIDSSMEYELRSLLKELYYTAAVFKWMRYIAAKSNDIKKMLEENNGDVCVTVEKIDYHISSYHEKMDGNFDADDRHQAYYGLNLKENWRLRFGYMVTVSIKDRVETSEDRANLVFKTQSQVQMYLDEYEYQQIFRTEGVMDLSFADQKCIEMNESAERAKRFTYEKLGEPMVPLLCDKQAAG